MDQAQGLRGLVEAAFRDGVRGSPLDTPSVRPAWATSRVRLVTITSGKGGVGKSNLSVNLALCLSRWGYRTWLWDVDAALGNVDILLGLMPKYHLGHVIVGDCTFRDIVLEGPQGLRVIPAGSGWQQLADLSSWRLQRLIDELTFLETEADFVLMDTGAGIGQGVIQFALAGHEVIVVTTPEPTAVADAYGLLKVIAAANPSASVQLVVNQARDEDEARAVHEHLNRVTSRFLNRQFRLLGSIPRDEWVRIAVRQQQPFLLAFPGCPASRAVEAIARRIVGVQEIPAQPGGLRGVIGRMVGLLRGKSSFLRPRYPQPAEDPTRSDKDPMGAGRGPIREDSSQGAGFGIGVEKGARGPVEPLQRRAQP